MKNCPFCAEEIQDTAIKCKHCGETLESEQPSMSPDSESTAPIKESRPLLLWICTILGAIAFVVIAVIAFSDGKFLKGLSAIGAGVIFLLIAPLGWTLGDLFRRFASPDMFFATGAIDLAKQKLFWIIGPQMIGVGIAFVILAVLITAPFENQKKTRQTVVDDAKKPSASAPAKKASAPVPAEDVKINRDANDAMEIEREAQKKRLEVEEAIRAEGRRVKEAEEKRRKAIKERIEGHYADIQGDIESGLTKYGQMDVQVISEKEIIVAGYDIVNDSCKCILPSKRMEVLEYDSFNDQYIAVLEEINESGDSNSPKNCRLTFQFRKFDDERYYLSIGYDGDYGCVTYCSGTDCSSGEASGNFYGNYDKQAR